MAGHPARPIHDVVAALRAAGLRLPKGVGDATELVEQALDDSLGLFSYGPDDEVLDVAATLHGRTFTHRLTEVEVHDSVLHLELDFAGLVWEHLMGVGLTLPAGETRPGAQHPVVPLFQVALAPTTWADLGVAVGDLVGVTFDSGAAHLRVVDAVGDARDLVAALDRILGDGSPMDADTLMDCLVVGTTHFRAPVAPLSQILAAHGFVVSGDLVAASGEVLDEVERAEMVRRLRTEFELTSGEAESVATFLGLVHAVDDVLVEEEGAEDADADDPAYAERLISTLTGLETRLGTHRNPLVGLRSALADPWLAEVAAAVALDPEDPCPEGLVLVAGILADHSDVPAGRWERASLAYLTGRCHEWAGDPIAAEAQFKVAVDLAPTHAAALVSLAGLAVDRGSYESAASLLDRAGVDAEHPLRTAIESARGGQSGPARTLGRNEPCWCGSGRKFKACHARASTTPLPSRALSILARALAWQAVAHPGLMRSVVMYAVTVGGRDAVESVLEIVPDAMLFEGGGLADYLERRGALVPDDEQLLAQQWLLRPRSLFEVEEVSAGSGLVLRDLATGDHVHVVERTASRQLAVGTLILTRVAPMGEVNELFGGVFPIQLHEREPLLALLAEEPSPPDLVAFLARRHRLPEMVTVEGGRLVHVEGTFTTTSPKQLRQALGSHLTPMGDDEWAITEPGMAGGSRVLASFTLSGRTLTVEAMSHERFDRALAVLDGIDVPLVERSREAVDPLAMPPDLSAQGDSPSPAGILDPAEHPEVQDALAAMIAEHERRWLDESIPALGGATPRQAAADPTRRPDLIRLLDSFPATGSPTMMDGARLKAALDL